MFNAFKFATLIATTALIAGCATTPPPEDALLWKGRSLASEANRTHKSLQSVNLKDLKWKKPGKITDFGDYREEQTWWCRDDDMPNEWAAVRLAFGELCRRQAGNFEGNFCSDITDRERVLFMAKITRFNDTCAQVEALVLVPKGSPDGVAYRERLIKEGFETNALRKAKADIEYQKRQATAIRQEQERAAESRRLAFELPQMQRKGASICRQDGAITFVAFVEDFAGDRLKVLVSHAYFTSTPSMSPGGFLQHFEWVSPEGWYTCEIRSGR